MSGVLKYRVYTRTQNTFNSCPSGADLVEREANNKDDKYVKCWLVPRTKVEVQKWMSVWEATEESMICYSITQKASLKWYSWKTEGCGYLEEHLYQRKNRMRKRGWSLMGRQDTWMAGREGTRERGRGWARGDAFLVLHKTGESVVESDHIWLPF